MMADHEITTDSWTVSIGHKCDGSDGAVNLESVAHYALAQTDRS